jgi:PDZ domain-containing protein
MDSIDVEDVTAEDGSPGAERDTWNPATIAERERLPKWPFVLAGILLLLGAMVAVAWPINVPYYALSPGPVNDTSDFVSVPEVEGEEVGDLLFLTVSLDEVNALEYLGAWLDEEVDLSPRENIRPAGVSQDALRQQNLDLMETSQTNATYVALTELGYDVTFEGSGAMVNSVVEGSAAEGLIDPGDTIIAVDGEPVEFSADAVELIGGRAPGEVVSITLLRPLGEDDTEELTVDITLGPFRYVDEDGDVEDDPDRGMVGVLLVNANTEVIFPIDVQIDSQNIGGPSAGLMFSLEVMNQLTPDDMTKGHRIAGTGSIDAEGNVGSIGGVRQKVFGAIRVGAEYVLVPAGNYEDALDAGGDDIEVVRVATIDDALTFLEELAPAT